MPRCSIHKLSLHFVDFSGVSEFPSISKRFQMLLASKPFGPYSLSFSLNHFDLLKLKVQFEKSNWIWILNLPKPLSSLNRPISIHRSNSNRANRLVLSGASSTNSKWGWLSWISDKFRNWSSITLDSTPHRWASRSSWISVRELNNPCLLSIDYHFE